VINSKSQRVSVLRNIREFAVTLETPTPYQKAEGFARRPPVRKMGLGLAPSTRRAKKIPPAEAEGVI
jgi:hypothetical protein